jgi:hypothetical protein
MLIVGTHIQTHRQQGDLISLLLFYQSKESRLKFALLFKGINSSYLKIREQLQFRILQPMNGIIVIGQ